MREDNIEVWTGLADCDGIETFMPAQGIQSNDYHFMHRRDTFLDYEGSAGV